jgi:hypothetical protein
VPASSFASRPRLSVAPGERESLGADVRGYDEVVNSNCQHGASSTPNRASGCSPESLGFENLMSGSPSETHIKPEARR